MAVNPQQLQQEHGWLLRLAQIQLRDAALAEDVVQETLVAALTAQHDGRSSVRTWLAGILRHKLVDAIRRESRFVHLAADDNDEIPEHAWDDLFTRNGHWSQPPQPWGQPEAVLNDRQFQAIFEQCQQRLPRRHAQVFMMREVMDMSIEEICNQLQLTPTNCSVILYRARMHLRACLEINWLQPGR